VVRVKEQAAGEEWPRHLWFFDESRWPCRHDWLCAALDFAGANGFRRLPIVGLMSNKLPYRGARLAVELPPECRERRPR
jgi:hypothetical protein